MSTIVLVIILLMGGVGFLIARSAWSRRVELDGVFCRRCAYRIDGSDSGRCPECGNPLSGPESVMQGRREPLRPALALGLALMVFSVGSLGLWWMAGVRQVDPLPYLPDWWLLRVDTTSAADGYGERAINELRWRHAEGRLSESSRRRFASLLAERAARMFNDAAAASPEGIAGWLADEIRSIVRERRRLGHLPADHPHLRVLEAQENSLRRSLGQSESWGLAQIVGNPDDVWTLPAPNANGWLGGARLTMSGMTIDLLNRHKPDDDALQPMLDAIVRYEARSGRVLVRGDDQVVVSVEPLIFEPSYFGFDTTSTYPRLRATPAIDGATQDGRPLRLAPPDQSDDAPPRVDRAWFTVPNRRPIEITLHVDWWMEPAVNPTLPGSAPRVYGPSLESDAPAAPSSDSSAAANGRGRLWHTSRHVLQFEPPKRDTLVDGR